MNVEAVKATSLDSKIQEQVHAIDNADDMMRRAQMEKRDAEMQLIVLLAKGNELHCLKPYMPAVRRLFRK
jgi:hypothetical protein